MDATILSTQDAGQDGRYPSIYFSSRLALLRHIYLGMLLACTLQDTTFNLPPLPSSAFPRVGSTTGCSTVDPAAMHQMTRIE